MEVRRRMRIRNQNRTAGTAGPMMFAVPPPRRCRREPSSKTFCVSGRCTLHNVNFDGWRREDLRAANFGARSRAVVTGRRGERKGTCEES
jgi:hypothetical protein